MNKLISKMNSFDTMRAMHQDLVSTDKIESQQLLRLPESSRQTNGEFMLKPSNHSVEE
jgi:hypothetical protein